MQLGGRFAASEKYGGRKIFYATLVVHLALKPMAFMAFDMFDIVFFIKLTLKFQYSNMTEK